MPLFVKFHLTNPLLPIVPLALSILFGVISVASQATELPMPRWHGQFSQGLIYTSDNRFFGDSEDVSFEFTDLAIGASWRPHARIQLAAQALYRQAGATSRDDVYTDYALINITLAERMSWKAGIKAGRIKNTSTLYNDTRDLASSRPSILLPESVYFDIIRDLFHTSDSIGLYAHTSVGNLLLQVDLLSGTPILTQPTQDELLQPPLAGNIENKDIRIARLTLETLDGRWRAGFTRSNLGYDYRPKQTGLSGNLFPSSFEFIVNSWSLQYSHENWQLTSEYQAAKNEITGLLGTGSQTGNTSEAYYLMASVEFAQRWHAYLRRDIYYSDKGDKDGRKFAGQTGQKAFHGYAFDTTLGIRHQLDRHWLVAAEVHDIKGTAWVADIETDDVDRVKNWMMFTAQINYQF